MVKPQSLSTIELTIVVPTRNERDNVGVLVSRLSNALKDVSWEVVFVDDDSPDRTFEAVKNIAARDSRVRCIRRVGRRGLAGACVEGMMLSAAPFIAVMDADLQHDAEILPKMLEELRCGADLVVGTRYADGGSVWNRLFTCSPLRVEDGHSPDSKPASDRNLRSNEWFLYDPQESCGRPRALALDRRF